MKTRYNIYSNSVGFEEGDQVGCTTPVSYTHLDVYKRQRLA